MSLFDVDDRVCSQKGCRRWAAPGRASCERCLERSRKIARRAREADPEKARARVARNRAKNPERTLELARKYYRAKTPEERRELGRAYRARHPEKVRDIDARQSLKRRYGLTAAQYQAMFAAQRGLCASCQEPEVVKMYGRTRALSVDHDHATAAVRGLLCSKCNVAIGHANDSQERLRAMATYLEDHGYRIGYIRGLPFSGTVED